MKSWKQVFSFDNVKALQWGWNEMCWEQLWGSRFLKNKQLLCNEFRASQVVLVIKNPPASDRDPRDAGSTPGSGRPPGGGHGNPLQCSGLENPMDRGAWWATVHGVSKSNTWSDLACVHPEYEGTHDWGGGGEEESWCILADGLMKDKL